MASSQLLVSTRSGIPSELVEFNLIQAGGEVLCDKVRTGNPPPGGSTDTANSTLLEVHTSPQCAHCAHQREQSVRGVCGSAWSDRSATSSIPLLPLSASWHWDAIQWRWYQRHPGVRHALPSQA